MLPTYLSNRYFGYGDGCALYENPGSEMVGCNATIALPLIAGAYVSASLDLVRGYLCPTHI
jgi:hypothetical protein